MAQKKPTQAQKASQAKNTRAPSGKKESVKAVERAQQQTVYIPARAVGVVVYGALFVLFMVIAMGQQGFVLNLVGNFTMGLFGKVAFYISIPGMLYLFIIQAFSGKNPALLRSCCTLAFIFLCGCISHLSLDPHNLGEGFGYVIGLYKGGITGSTGGVVCGLSTELLKSAFGVVFSYIVLIVSAIICLMAAFRFTIPSMIRAIQNRPRDEEDEEEEWEEPPEPAAVVVNHIATKRIEQKQRKRLQQQAREDQAALDQWNADEEHRTQMGRKDRVADMMRQLDGGEESSSDLITDLPMKAPKKQKKQANSEPVVSEEPVRPEPEQVPVPVPEKPEDIPIAPPVPEGKKKVTAEDTIIATEEVTREIEMRQAEERPVYCFPPIDLLTRSGRTGSDGTAEMRENTTRLNEVLASFKIDAKISNVTRGPSVTRYEVHLEKGVRLNKLTNSADDIALNLGASGVRVAPVPGLASVVGIEVPNKTVSTVRLRDVIDSPEFNKAKSKSSFCVGKDIGGSNIVGNIAKFPHLLIAGTTGSGKSVCMNSIIISLIYKAGPEDVKLIMVDPKMVELGIYNGIPHLLIPVVTDPKKAAGSLQWAVTEMLRRYRSMSDAGVRDLEAYNSMIDNQEIEGEHLPQVVVIIDELADLMLVAAKEVEESICRIAQMGRAAGIHLIIATQRPSADVITGLMKANIPSRIAFSVSSAMESRIILDTVGAEKLVGMGDMLYAPIGCGKPMRVQGCFVSDEEVEAVAQYVKNHFVSDYDQTIMDEIDKQAEQTGKKAAAASDPEPSMAETEGDEMLPAAVDVVLENKMASVSLLQRRLKLGYARAARIMDEMEEKGIVGPLNGSKPRQILITREQWDQIQSGQTLILDEEGEEILEAVPEDNI